MTASMSTPALDSAERMDCASCPVSASVNADFPWSSVAWSVSGGIVFTVSGPTKLST